jgi:hypothetical protein
MGLCSEFSKVPAAQCNEISATTLIMSTTANNGESREKIENPNACGFYRRTASRMSTSSIIRKVSGTSARGDYRTPHRTHHEPNRTSRGPSRRNGGGRSSGPNPFGELVREFIRCGGWLNCTEAEALATRVPVIGSDGEMHLVCAHSVACDCGLEGITCKLGSRNCNHNHTRMCRNFIRNGRCRFGDRCNLDHFSLWTPAHSQTEPVMSSTVEVHEANQPSVGLSGYAAIAATAPAPMCVPCSAQKPQKSQRRSSSPGKFSSLCRNGENC